MAIISQCSRQFMPDSEPHPPPSTKTSKRGYFGDSSRTGKESLEGAEKDLVLVLQHSSLLEILNEH